MKDNVNYLAHLRKEDCSMKDNVNHPAHYNAGGIECIDAIDAACTGLSGSEAFYVGNAIKYIWRFKFKNGVEDLEKAIFYLNRLRDKIEEQEKTGAAR